VSIQRSLRRPGLRRIAAAVVPTLALLGLSACSDPPPAGPSLADTLARDRAAAFFQSDKMDQARAEIAPLASRKDAAVEDLVRAAAIEFAAGVSEAAEGFLVRAAQQAPESPAVNFLRGQLRFEIGAFEEALGYFETAHRAAPGDLPTTILLAQILEDLDQVERAEQLYLSVIEVGIENGGSWYVSAVYRMGQLLLMEDRGAESQRYLLERDALRRAGIQAPSAVVVARGNYGAVRPPRPTGTEVPAPIALPTFAAAPPILPELGGARTLHALELNGDRHIDLVAELSDAVVAAVRTEDGRDWTVTRIHTGPVDHLRGFDLGNDDDLDFVAVTGARVVLLVADECAWTPSEKTLPDLPAPPADLVFVDFDHEGDMDLLLVGPFGARLWRNDGLATEEGGFTDVTAEAGLPVGGAFAWCLTEDLDGDNDVDFLLGGPAERASRRSPSSRTSTATRAPTSCCPAPRACASPRDPTDASSRA